MNRARHGGGLLTGAAGAKILRALLLERLDSADVRVYAGQVARDGPCASEPPARFNSGLRAAPVSLGRRPAAAGKQERRAAN